MNTRIRSIVLAVVLASPILAGVVAVWVLREPAAVVEIRPQKPPAQLTDIRALRPRPIVINRSPDEWQREQRLTQPEVHITPVVARPSLSVPDAVVSVLDSPDVEPIASVEIEDSVPVAELLDAQGRAGSLAQGTWAAGETMHGASIATPVLVATGAKPGPSLCITAAVHGDELNGIETVRRLLHSVDPKKLKGRLVGVPIVNLHGFQRQSRYLADRRDLNRFFPGNATGSSASRIAHSLFQEVIRHCDALVDLHTGSFHRTNLPQLRADLNNPDVLELTKSFGSTIVLHSPGGPGTLRRSTADAGIPAVTLEAGEPLRLQGDAVDHSVKALFTLLDAMGLYRKRSLWGTPEPTYYSSAWVRSDHGGILLSNVKLGRRVSEGQRLGTVTDPITNEQMNILAPYDGRIIGMALNQFVMPGFATFHVARQTQADGISDDEHEVTNGVDFALMGTLGDDESE